MIWPYEEVNISFKDDTIHLVAPWIKVSMQSKIPKNLQEKFIQVLGTGPQTAEDMAFTQKVLAPFEKFPLFYFLSRVELTPDSHIKVSSEQPDVQNRSSWQLEEILKKSKIAENQYDLRSVLGGVRRCHLLDIVRTAPTTSVAMMVSEIRKTQSKNAVAFLVRQNHYITEYFLDIIAAAKPLHPKLVDELDEYMRSETGHDRLLARSIESLGQKPDDIEVLPSLVRFIEECEKWSGRNVLALAFSLDVMERSPFSGKDAFLDLLKEMNLEDVAKPLIQHRNINVEEEHFNQSFKILEPMGSVSEVCARQALDSAKYLSDLFIEFAEKRVKKVSEICQNCPN